MRQGQLVWGRGEVYTGFSWGSLRERVNLKARSRRDDNIEVDLQEMEWGHGLE